MRFDVFVTLTTLVTFTASVDPLFQPCGTPAIIPQTTVSTRIIGGHDAVPYSWPWQVAIFAKVVLFEQLACGGTIISDQWILTAAHCFCGPMGEMVFCKNTTSQTLKNYKVKLGVFNISGDLEEGGQDARISEVHVHPLYNYRVNTYDIALLKLTNPINYTDHISPVCLPMFQNAPLPAPGTTLFSTGWGKTSSLGDVSTSLKQLAMPLVESRVCNEVYGRFGMPVFEDVMVCAGYAGGTQGHVCNGDSGGPLVYHDPSTNTWAQLGITSWGGYCTSYGVYSKVSAFTDFIQGVVCPNATELCEEGQFSTSPTSAVNEATTIASSWMETKVIIFILYVMKSL